MQTVLAVILAFGIGFFLRAILALKWADKVRQELSFHQFSDDAFEELFPGESIWKYRRYGRKGGR